MRTKLQKLLMSRNAVVQLAQFVDTDSATFNLYLNNLNFALTGEFELKKPQSLINHLVDQLLSIYTSQQDECAVSYREQIQVVIEDYETTFTAIQCKSSKNWMLTHSKDRAEKNWDALVNYSSALDRLALTVDEPSKPGTGTTFEVNETPADWDALFNTPTLLLELYDSVVNQRFERCLHDFALQYDLKLKSAINYSEWLLKHFVSLDSQVSSRYKTSVQHDLLDSYAPSLSLVKVSIQILEKTMDFYFILFKNRALCTLHHLSLVHKELKEIQFQFNMATLPRAAQ